MKNEALGSMKTELLGKTLSDTMVSFTNQADLLLVEEELRKAEVSCRGAFLN